MIQRRRRRWIAISIKYIVKNKGKSYPHSSGDADEPAETRPQTLNTLAIAQAHTLLEARVVLELAGPLMRVGMHGRRAKFDALESVISNDFKLCLLLLIYYGKNTDDLLC